VREGLSRPLWLAVVAVAFALPLFVGLNLTDMENDEAIYSYAVDGIIAGGDWLNPLSSPHEDAVFLEKPPLKFWIVAAPIAAGLLPHNELGMRVWDALFGGLAFLYVFAFGRRLAGPVCGVVAVFVLFVYRALLFEHGLRNNNMEAPLVLCYCGALYHYMAWASAEAKSSRWWHALAVSLFFFLGFMTKFVAALFLPILAMVATTLQRDTRNRLLADWKTWAAAAAVFLCLAAPWFVYQQIRVGAELWRIILGAHVIERMTVSVDPSHIQPWNFYFVTISRELVRTGTIWLVGAGGVVLIARAIRYRRLEELLVVAWFFVPMTLMSIGTSKLHHYAYPFLPPLALAAGYLPGLIVQASREPVDVAMTWLTRRFIEPRGWGTVVRQVCIVVAAAAALLAVVTLVLGQVQIRIGDVQLFRSSHVFRPVMVAFVLLTVAGFGVQAARWMVPIAMLIAVAPSQAYADTWIHIRRDEHPMRATRDCLLDVRTREHASGRPPLGIYSVHEQGWLLHSHYYYFRHLVPWLRLDQLDERVVAEALFVPGKQRPVMMGDADYQAFKLNHAEELVSVPALRLREVLLLMPGPYAVCGPTRNTNSLRLK
jgi:4-amino-4-deoxy-L-arabinose transferase-like glycosyltransferase